MPEQHTDDPLLGDGFAAALMLALTIHARQVRKGTQIPYATHLLSVASLALEAGATEEVAMAALLHDAVEDSADGTATLAVIRATCGEKVASIVMECSDAIGVADGEKAPWRDRKLAHLAHLTTASPEALLVTAADKLHNARCTIADVHELGDAAWSRFSAPVADQLWYYGEMSRILSSRLPCPLTAELARAVVTLRNLSSPSVGLA